MKDLLALTREALHLPAKDRARLAERLLESLDQLSQDEIEQLWAREATSRVEAHRAGRLEAHPAAEVHREIRRRLG